MRLDSGVGLGLDSGIGLGVGPRSKRLAKAQILLRSHKRVCPGIHLRLSTIELVVQFCPGVGQLLGEWRALAKRWSIKVDHIHGEDQNKRNAS